MIGIDILGADAMDIIDALSSGAKGITQYVTDTRAEKEAKADAEAKLKAAIAADADAAVKIAAALLSAEQAKADPKLADAAAADKMVADDARAAVAQAAAELPAQAVPRRVAEVKKLVSSAQVALQQATRSGAAPLKLAAKCRVAAANEVLSLAQGLPVGGRGAKTPSVPTEESGGFFTKKVLGPVRVWHLGLGLVAGAGGFWYWKGRAPIEYVDPDEETLDGVYGLGDLDPLSAEYLRNANA